MKSLETYTTELKDLLGRVPARLPTDTTYPKLTVVTPSFNQGKYLERTILSVLNQRYPNLEYIVIDGGSTDESIEVLRKYDKYLEYWVSEPDRGQVDALNKGLARATGEWIGFQNSDDVYFANTFHHFAQAVRKYGDADIVYGDLCMITPTDQVTELLKTLPYSFNCQLVEGMQIHNQSLFFKKRLLDRYGYFDSSYQFAFDYEFITRFTSRKGVTTRRVEGLAGALRVHDEAKSSTIAQVGREEHGRIRAAYSKENTLPLPGKLQYLCCRLRKMALLLVQGDWDYVAHRKSIR